MASYKRTSSGPGAMNRVSMAALTRAWLVAEYAAIILVDPRRRVPRPTRHHARATLEPFARPGPAPPGNRGSGRCLARKRPARLPAIIRHSPDALPAFAGQRGTVRNPVQLFCGPWRRFPVDVKPARH